LVRVPGGNLLGITTTEIFNRVSKCSERRSISLDAEGNDLVRIMGGYGTTACAAKHRTMSATQPHRLITRYVPRPSAGATTLIKRGSTLTSPGLNRSLLPSVSRVAMYPAGEAGPPAAVSFPAGCAASPTTTPDAPRAAVRGRLIRSDRFMAEIQPLTRGAGAHFMLRVWERIFPPRTCNFAASTHDTDH
jgi:hypothetical protein